MCCLVFNWRHSLNPIYNHFTIFFNICCLIFSWRHRLNPITIFTNDLHNSSVLQSKSLCVSIDVLDLTGMRNHKGYDIMFHSVIKDAIHD